MGPYNICALLFIVINVFTIILERTIKYIIALVNKKKKNVVGIIDIATLIY